MKKMMKKSMAMLLALVMCLGIATTASAVEKSPFSDVPTTFWSYEHIKEMSDRGVVKGYADGTFGPSISVSAAHFTVMLSRAFFADTLGAPVQSPWYGAELTNLMNHKIMDGTTMWRTYNKTGSFSSSDMNAPLTRYDMAQMMYNVLVAKGIKLPSASELEATKAKIADFKEVPESYKAAVLTNYTLGTLQGFDSIGSFKGNSIMNRSQACAVMGRLFDVIEKSNGGNGGGNKPTDNVPPPESMEELMKDLDEGQKMVMKSAGFDIVSDAADVNKSIDAGKSNVYPTAGKSDTVNQNGYHTVSTLDLSGCKLEYDGMAIADKYRAERKAKVNPLYLEADWWSALQWMKTDTAEECVMAVAKYHPENSYSLPGCWVKANSLEEAFEKMYNAFLYEKNTGTWSNMDMLLRFDTSHFAMASYEDESGKYYAMISNPNPLYVTDDEYNYGIFGYPF